MYGRVRGITHARNEVSWVVVWFASMQALVVKLLPLKRSCGCKAFAAVELLRQHAARIYAISSISGEGLQVSFCLLPQTTKRYQSQIMNTRIIQLLHETDKHYFVYSSISNVRGESTTVHIQVVRLHTTSNEKPRTLLGNKSSFHPNHLFPPTAEFPFPSSPKGHYGLGNQ